MGNFYVNLTVRTTKREEIGNLLAGRDAFISPVLNGSFVVVYDKEADYQAWPLIETLAKDLSARLATSVFVVVNHDDDVLFCALYDRGEQMDLYNSNPDFFEDTRNKCGPTGGNADILGKTFGVKDVATVEAVLRKPGADSDDGYLFAHRRHRDLMQALGLTSQAFFVGYNYQHAGEFPSDLSKTDFIEVGGRP
jgi:hypothetical protein